MVDVKNPLDEYKENVIVESSTNNQLHNKRGRRRKKYDEGFLKYDKNGMVIPMDGQEEIFKCLYERDHIKLWNIVRYVGCNVVQSENVRKMCFFAAFNDFDYKNNNNFLTFFKDRLRYLEMNNFSTRIRGLVRDKRALVDYERHKWWPSQEEQENEPINQNANILRNFSL